MKSEFNILRVTYHWTLGKSISTYSFFQVRGWRERRRKPQRVLVKVFRDDTQNFWSTYHFCLQPSTGYIFSSCNLEIPHPCHNSHLLIDSICFQPNEFKAKAQKLRPMDYVCSSPRYRPPMDSQKFSPFNTSLKLSAGKRKYYVLYWIQC